MPSHFNETQAVVLSLSLGKVIAVSESADDNPKVGWIVSPWEDMREFEMILTNLENGLE